MGKPDPPKLQTTNKNLAQNPPQNNTIKSFLRSGTGLQSKPGLREPKEIDMNTTDEKLQLILEKLSEQTREIQDLNKRMSEYKDLVRDTVTEIVASKEAEWNEERAALIRRVEYLEQREEAKMRQEKRNNIIIRGLQLETHNSQREVESFLNENLQLSIKVAEAVPIQVSRGKNLIVAKISSMEEKISIMQNKRRLQDSSIPIASDRTKKERDTQRQIHSIAEELKNEGKTVTVGYRKVIVDGVTMVWNDDGKLYPKTTNRGSPLQDPQRRRSPSYPRETASA
ncbi:hypothetical protein QAD02_002710 [Eretmocerus hayati]|uniref:Uncharacterized protein n=1 Tax=Eretmocerus hayati TaxID=131215 RepID=A0ACC2NK39_9HYME|nr:hypothetical protein QAD02_002710 [Eretmocerus hayati]